MRTRKIVPQETERRQEGNRQKERKKELAQFGARDLARSCCNKLKGGKEKGKIEKGRK